MQLPGASTRLFRAQSTATEANESGHVATGLVPALRLLPAPIVERLQMTVNGDGWDVDAVISGLDRGIKSAEGVCLQVLDALAGPVDGQGTAGGTILVDPVTVETKSRGDEVALPADPGRAPQQPVQADLGDRLRHSDGSLKTTPELLKGIAGEFQSLFTKAVEARVRSEEALLDHFLGPADLGQLLVVEVDQAILDARMGPSRDRAMPGRRGRKRSVPQGAGARRGSVDLPPSKWNAQTQSQLYLLMTCLLGTAPLYSYGSMTKLTRKLASKLQFTGACQGMQLIGATLDDVREALDGGRFVDPDEFLSSVEVACKEAVDAYLLEEPGVRKGKVVGYADSFVKAVSQALVDLLGLQRQRKSRPIPRWWPNSDSMPTRCPATSGQVAHLHRVQQGALQAGRLAQNAFQT